MREKKSETLEVRLSHRQKRAFMAIAEARGSSASSLVRSFIDGAIDDAGRTEPRRRGRAPLKELSMTLTRNPRKAATGAIGALGALTLFALTPSVADDQVFERLDTDADGTLTLAELQTATGKPDTAAALMRSLDANKNGALDPSELTAPLGCLRSVENATLELDGTRRRILNVTYTIYDLSDPEEASINISSATTTTDDPLDDAAIARTLRQMDGDARDAGETATPANGCPAPITA